MNANTDLVSKARRFEDEGKFDLAIETYKQALESGEGDQAILYQEISRQLLKLGRLDESVSACQEALKLNPELPIAYGVLGTIHCMRGQYTQAETELREALRLKPDYVSAVINLARMHLISGQYQEASSMYEKAVMLQPQNLEIRIALVRAYLAQVQPALALPHLNTAVRLKPTAPAVYLWYAPVIVQGGSKSLVQSGFWGAVVIVGLLAIALVGPVQVSVPVGVLVSAFAVLTLFVLVYFLLQRGQRRRLVGYSLSLGLYCGCYWLLVWVHSMYTLWK